MFKNLFLILTPVFIFLVADAQQGPASRLDSTRYNPIKIIPANYYLKQLGPVCRQELRVQKSTGLNLFFRLGSKDYVDYMEQKPNAKKFLP